MPEESDHPSASDPESESESEESELSDSDLEVYEKKSYLQLRSAPVGSQIRVINPDSTYRCPYCPGKKKRSYTYKDLLAHATGVGASTTSSRRKPREVAHHRALARYLKSDIGNGTSVVISTSNGKVATTSFSAEASTSRAQPIEQNEVYILLFFCFVFFFFFFAYTKSSGDSQQTKLELSDSGKFRIVE